MPWWTFLRRWFASRSVTFRSFKSAWVLVICITFHPHYSLSVWVETNACKWWHDRIFIFEWLSPISTPTELLRSFFIEMFVCVHCEYPQFSFFTFYCEPARPFVQVTSASAFAQTLRRYTSLNHLAQAARAVLQNTAQISQMLSDLNRVDFANVQVCATRQINEMWR